MFKLSEAWIHLKQMNRYIGFSFVLFFAGIVIGGTNESFHVFLNGQLAGLEEIVRTIEDAENRTLTMFSIIFFNNTIKSILMMYFGLLFAIIPIFFLMVNGMIVGYLLQQIASTPEAPSVLSVIVKGLLPHGIIEIPAIVIASAYGIRLGVLLFQLLGSVLFRRNKLSAVMKELERVLIRTVPMIVILTVALLIAALIESTFTDWLVRL